MTRKIFIPFIVLLLLSSMALPFRLNASPPDASKLSEGVIYAIAHGDGNVPLLIETHSRPYASITEDILRLGGSVSVEYKYVNGLAAILPANQIEQLAQNSNVKRISLDTIVGLPEESLEDREFLSGLEEDVLPVSFTAEDLLAREDLDVDGDVDIIDASILAYAFEATPDQAAWNPRADIDRDGDVDIVDASLLAYRFGTNPSIEPSNYINSAVSGVTGQVLSSSGFGEDTILAIMDTGINTRHFLLSRPGMVVGGVDLSCDAINHAFCTPARRGFPGFDRFENQFHGSFVASVAAGSGAAAFLTTSLLVRSIELYSGTTLPSGPPDAMGRPTKIVPLSGIAPKAQLYIVKVFDHTGLGIAESLVIQGIEHIIDKKVVDGVDIDVVNMSLGGVTLFDGRDLLDKAADAATAAGLTMVIAAGNDGPAPNTVASAGSAETAVTVGAAVTPVHARVFWDNRLGIVGVGSSLYTTNAIQIRDFSARGPTSDCRSKPDLVAAGSNNLAAFAERSNTGVAFSSGTSFSTPGVAGAISLLNSFAEKNGLATSPFDYKQAVVASAEPIAGWSARDQGAGFLEVAGALAVLQNDPVLGDTQTGLPEDAELCNIANIQDAGPGQKSASFTFPGITLQPGFGRDFVFAARDLESITVQVSNVNLGTSNPLGVNSFEVYIKGPRRTAGLADYHIDSANVFGDAAFTITDDATIVTGNAGLPPCIGNIRVPPCASGRQIDFFDRRVVQMQAGFYKVRFENDYTSAGALSGDLTIQYVKAARASHDITISGVLKEGQSTGFIPITVPAGTSKAVVGLRWVHDWSVYPTNDLDVFVVNGTKVDVRGATLRSPERVVILNPASDLAVMVQAFTISQTQGMTAASEPFVLTVDFVS